MIQSTKIQQQEAIIKSNHETILTLCQQSLPATILTKEAYPAGNPNTSATESAQALATTNLLSTIASTTIETKTMQETTFKEYSTKASISENTSNRRTNKIVVPATIAEAHRSMAYSATLEAQALTNAHWPIANARATVSKMSINQHKSTSYKDILTRQKFTMTTEPFNAPTTEKLPMSLTPTQQASSTKLSTASTNSKANSNKVQDSIQAINAPITLHAALKDVSKTTINSARQSTTSKIQRLATRLYPLTTITTKSAFVVPVNAERYKIAVNAGQTI